MASPACPKPTATSRGVPGFKRYPIGYFHIDIAEVQTADGSHSFELACAQNNIEHRRTLPRHPWTIGQVERMNRTIKEATVRRFHYGSHDQLRMHLADFLAADLAP
jgi:transposase InsO family protein